MNTKNFPKDIAVAILASSYVPLGSPDDTLVELGAMFLIYKRSDIIGKAMMICATSGSILQGVILGQEIPFHEIAPVSKLLVELRRRAELAIVEKQPITFSKEDEETWWGSIGKSTGDWIRRVVWIQFYKDQNESLRVIQ